MLCPMRPLPWLLPLLLLACGESPLPVDPQQIPEALALDQAPPLRAGEGDLAPERADTVGGGEGKIRDLIGQAGLDEDLASQLAALDETRGDQNQKVITFSKLSLARADYGLLLDHLYPDPAREGVLPPFEFPEAVAALAGTEVELLGYMLPTEYKDARVLEFMLVRDTGSCCFGGIPRPDEFALVTVTPKDGFEYFPYLPIVVTGRLTLVAPGSDPDLPLVYTLAATAVRRYY